MKKTIFVLAASLLLSGCGVETPSTSSEPLSEDSSSSEPTTSLSETEQAKQDFAAFLAAIEEANGHPSEASMEMKVATSYLSDGDPLTITYNDTFTLKRYHRSQGSDVLMREGSYAYEGSIGSYTYQTQTYAGGGFFYRLTKEDGVPSSGDSTIYRAEAVELNLGFSLHPIQEENLNYLEGFLGESGYLVEYSLPRAIPAEGECSFAYSLTKYASGLNLDWKISHEYALQIEGGVIASYTYSYAQDLYAGGVKANWQESETKATFAQGDYPLYEGEVWDPEDFPSA